MIRDPERRGRALADLHALLAPRLFADLEQSGLLAGLDPAGLGRARREWEYCALYACVRGLVAAGGFNQETGRALEAFHAAVREGWVAAGEAPEELAGRSQELSSRYDEYGGIGQRLEHGGRDRVASEIGAAAARHVGPAGPALDQLGRLLGDYHESVAEGAAEAVRREG